MGQAAHAIEKVLGGSVTALRFETPSRDVTVLRSGAAEDNAGPAPAPRLSHGAIEGRVQALSNRSALRFTLYDSLFDRAVSCYLSRDDSEAEATMRDTWGRRAVVEGLIGRDALTGRPLAVRRTRGVHVLPESTPDGYRKARAVLPRDADGISPEAAIRLFRDAWAAAPLTADDCANGNGPSGVRQPIG